MKIGYFVRYFPYEDSSSNEHYFGSYGAGGSPKSSYSLIREISKRNKVAVFTTSLDSKDSIETHGNLTINRFATSFRYAGASLSPRMLLGARKIEDLDVVHGHLDIPPGPLSAILCAMKTDTPFVLTYHGDWISNYGNILRRVIVSVCNMTVVEMLIRESDAIISPSARYINESKYLRRVKEKTIAIPNGLTFNECCTHLSKKECREILGLHPDRRLILFMSSLQPYKGPQILIQAMVRIRERVPDTELVIAGQGWMIQELQKMCKKLEMEHCIHFVGYIQDSEKKACMFKSADVFAFPSFSESFGNVGLEAMANGVPVVASRVGGIPDVIIDGKTGLLVPPGDSITLAETITQVLENETLRAQMGEAGMVEAAKYSWENAATSTEKVYRRLIG